MKNDSPSHLIKGLEPEGVYFFDPEKTKPAEERQTSSDLATTIFSDALPKNMAVLCQLAERQGYQRGVREVNQQAYEAGWHEGYEFGIRQGEDAAHLEVKSSMSVLTTLMEGFSQFRQEIYEDSKPEIINFCLKICEVLLQRELSDPIRHIRLIESLLAGGKSFLEDVPITIRLSPDDFTAIHRTLERYPETASRFQRIHFVEDESIKTGNCLIQTSLGLINFDIHRQLEDIEKKILSSDLTD